jgi:hypothetical protein
LKITATPVLDVVLEVSPAGYYAWRERPGARAASNSKLLAEIRQVTTAFGAMAVHGSMPLCDRRDVVPAAAGSNG